MCVSLCWCAYQTQDTMPAKNCWPNNKWMRTQQRKVRKREKGRRARCSLFGGSGKQLKLSLQSWQRSAFCCRGGIKKVCLVPVHGSSSSSSTRSNYASCLLLFSQAINFCPDFTCPAPELPTHTDRHIKLFVCLCVCVCNRNAFSTRAANVQNSISQPH